MVVSHFNLSGWWVGVSSPSLEREVMTLNHHHPHSYSKWNFNKRKANDVQFINAACCSSCRHFTQLSHVPCVLFVYHYRIRVEARYVTSLFCQRNAFTHSWQGENVRCLWLSMGWLILGQDHSSSNTFTLDLLVMSVTLINVLKPILSFSPTTCLRSPVSVCVCLSLFHRLHPLLVNLLLLDWPSNMHTYAHTEIWSHITSPLKICF